MTIRFLIVAGALAWAAVGPAFAGEVPLPDTGSTKQWVGAEKMLPFAALANELGERRRRVVYTGNAGSPANGVLAGLVQVGSGTLSFRRRDLVTSDISPIVAARVYASDGLASDDFGAGGWRFSLAARLTLHGDGGWLETPGGLRLRLARQGAQIVPRVGYSGIREVRRDGAEQISVRFADGYTLRYARQAPGDYRLAGIEDGRGNGLRIELGDRGQVVAVTAPNSELLVQRDGRGRITGLRDDTGRTIGYEYAGGRLAAVTDIGGHRWTYEYDERDRLLLARAPDGRDDLAVAYDNAGRVVALLRHGLGREFEYGLRLDGHADLEVTSVTDASGVARLFGHDAQGLTVLAGRAGAAPMRVHLDHHNRPLRVEQAGDTRHEFSYRGNALAGWRRAYGSPASFHFAYDEQGRPKSVRDDSGSLVAAVRRDGGDTLVDRGEESFSFRIGDAGLLARAASADGPAYAFSHDGGGRVTRVLDSDGRAAVLKYSTGGLLTEAAFPGGQVHRYVYDALGLRQSTRVSTGAGASYRYAADGRMQSYRLNAPDGTAVETEHRLDAAGRLAHIARQDKSFAIDYGPADRPLSISSGQRRLRFHYDQRFRLDGVDDGTNHWRYRYASEDETDLVQQAEPRRFGQRFDASQPGPLWARAYDELYLRRQPAYLGVLDLDTDAASFVVTHPLGVRLPDQPVRDLLQALNFIDKHGGPLITADNSDARVAFNSPSGLLFVPPEFRSLNCVVCLGQHPFAISPSRGTSDAWPDLQLLTHWLQPRCYLDPDNPPPPGCGIEISGLPEYLCAGNEALIGATLTPAHLQESYIGWTAGGSYLDIVPPTTSGDQVRVRGVTPTSFAASGTGAVAASYDRLGVSCADAATVPVIVNQPDTYSTVVDTDLCPERQQQMQRDHDIDGCSIPPVVTWLAFSGDMQDPIGGQHHAPGMPTEFGRVEAPLPFGQPPLDLPCNRHDVCYQTCGRNQLGCDNDFLDDMRDVCAASYPATCPFNAPSTACAQFELEKIQCALGSTAMFQGVRLAGGIAYRGRQVSYCQCCPPS